LSIATLFKYNVILGDNHFYLSFLIDVDYKYILEDFVYFVDVKPDADQSSATYPCVLDKTTGHIVYHPNMYHEDEAADQHRRPFPQRLRLHVLEEEDEAVFNSIEKHILQTPVGSITIQESANSVEVEEAGFFRQPPTSTTASQQQMRTKLKRYHWEHVAQGPFIVILVTEEAASSEVDRNNLSGGHGVHFITPAAMRLKMPKPQMSSVNAVYHRLDLLPNNLQSKLCRHLHFPATLETGSVFLAPEAFDEPYDQNTLSGSLNNSNLTSKQMFNYMSYLTSNQSSNIANAVVNPGLKDQVKPDVQLLSQVISTWRNMSFASGLNNYIVRRYAI
jgi:hypothetical protein